MHAGPKAFKFLAAAFASSDTQHPIPEVHAYLLAKHLCKMIETS